MASYIAVEGCLAVGKTTMARELSRRLGIEVLHEDFSKHPFLPEFYVDPRANGLETELAFSIIHYHAIASAMRKGLFRTDVIADFFYEKTMIFHKVTLTPKKDAVVFESLWNSLRERLPTPDLIVYIDAPTEFLVKRVKQRGREYEKPITFEYLDKVNREYRKFMKTYKRSEVISVDAITLDTQNNPDPFGEVADSVRAKLGIGRGKKASRRNPPS